MQVDLGNALDSVATPGVSRESLERLDERVADAHERILEGIDEREHGYAALTLPETVDADVVYAATDPIDCETLLVCGIGGSALGAATLADALDLDIDVYTLDNVDPEGVEKLLGSVDLSKTALHVVSRSGTTVETLANFLVVREEMNSKGVDWTERTLVTTGADGNLRKLAERHDLPVLDVPAGVPGRFSALSTVGLPVVALGGSDVEALVSGARAESESLAGSLFDCPAYAYGATSYALAQRGWTVNAMMPYADSLETFSEWFAQLWAESLGKDGLGQLPARALGATDQHSQLQLYRAGPRNAMVTLVRPKERSDITIPETDLEGLSYLEDSSLGELLDAEFEATEASLATSGRPNIRLELERVDAHELGSLLYGMEAACILAGELFSVPTFTQPAVEWGKNAARGLLGGGSFTEMKVIEEKHECIVD